MRDQPTDRRRTAVLAVVTATALLVALGVATVVVIGPLREASRLLDGVPAATGVESAVAEASLRLLAVMPLLVLVTAAVLAVPLRDWARHRAPETPGRIDPLTGMATRPVLHERLRQAAAASGRHGQALAVMVLDLDGFREVNDQHHHAIGDLVLIEVAERLQSMARRTDLVCRHRGTEFVVLAEHLDGPSGAGVVADKLLACLRDPIRVDGRTVRLTASLGIALCPSDTDVPHELLQLAEGAMRESKRDGGDTYRFSAVDLRTEHEVRQATLVELRSAFEDQELELAYQPQIALRAGEVVSAEALLRWRRDDESDPVPAGRFIALTENTELAERLGRWVIDTAVAQVAEWHARPSGPRLAVAVNIGLRHIRHGTLVGDVRAALERHGVDPVHLELEVPETALGADPERVIPALEALHGIGVRLVLDEFGTGQTSLQHLPDLPLHAIKLDATLGDRLAGSGAGMVAGLVGLGRELGLEVILPRVEHAGQLRRARQLGCDRAQGYLISPPLAPDAVGADAPRAAVPTEAART